MGDEELQKTSLFLSTILSQITSSLGPGLRASIVFIMARILSISYEPVLLSTREMLLRQMGHEVVSAEGFARAYQACEVERGGFDLIVLGHSIPHDDKREIIKRCIPACSCPLLVLLRLNEPPVEGAFRSIDSAEPEAFVSAIHEILQS
ncbi:MAG TPA: hypothetical protein VI636_03545 [Candidatus Angelobacter sp.]